ncbi:MAG TPA: LOG family protein [Chloroflexota bacterium]
MRVTVFGSARTGPETQEYQDALRLGRMLAERGDIIVSGGYGGIMEAVSRGAHEAGGEVVGVTVAPWVGRLEPNRYLSEERSARTLFERLEGLIESDALIAMPGGAGTLGEIALAWNLRQMDLMAPKPVVLVGQQWKEMVEEFRQHLIIDDEDVALLVLVDTVDEALAALEHGAGAQPHWFG